MVVPLSLAYSYIRFSTPQQAAGGSLDRQTRLTEDYCRRKGHTLDLSLNLHDLGVSAFRGSNVREGALAGFLEACRIGRVKPGSLLVVESLDRLSRDQIRPALQLFLSIQDHGVTIVTLQPEREYPPNATDALSLIEPLIIFSRAHEESLMKSHRRTDAWNSRKKEARAKQRPVMKTCPAWLTNEDGVFSVKPEAARAIQRIYGLCQSGMGVYRIVQTLVREGVKPFGTSGKWNTNYVYLILTTPAVSGVYQPKRQRGKSSVPDGESIPGYYPVVIPEEQFVATQAAIASRMFNKSGGRAAQATYIFSGLVWHAGEDRPMVIVTAMGRQKKQYRYLAVAEASGAARLRVLYESFEAAMLTFLTELKPQDVSPGAVDSMDELSRLSGRLADIDSKLERAAERARGSDDFDSFLDLIEGLQKERKKVVKRLGELRERGANYEAEALGETQSLVRMLGSTPEAELEELRVKLKTRARALITAVWIQIVGVSKFKRYVHVQVHLRTGEKRYFMFFHPERFAGAVPLPPGTDLSKQPRRPTPSPK